jgi:c-di-GMP-binding flagellar brake protein YcgR
VAFSVERGDEDDLEPPQYEGQTLNISGGGMLLTTSIKLEAGDNIPLQVYLSSREHITATGRVERVEFLGTKGLCLAGIVFDLIHEINRDKIVAFVFQREIELRRKGLL